jgi:hypothetical protein
MGCTDCAGGNQRCCIALAAFTLAATSLVIIELKLILALGGVTWPLLDHVFTISNIVTGPTVVTLLVLSVSLTWFYRRIAHLIQRVTTRRRRADAALLTYLQQRMLAVVPTVPHVELTDPHLQWNRALSEIADAREVLWSDTHRSTPITPNDEAERLFRLLQSNRQYGRDMRAGTSMHPPLEDEHVVEHNLAVALLLQRLEQQGTAPDREDAEHAERTP